MESSNQNTHLFDEQPKPLSGTLNVLTILTFIGCGLSYLGILYNLYASRNYQEQRARLEQQLDNLGGNNMATKMMEGSLEIMEKSYQYRYILFVSGLVFTTFCLIGAIKMRKQQKSGFPIYLIGEISPVVLTGVLIGFSLVGGLTTVISAIIALVFVILYSTQRKNLIYN